MFDFNSFFLNVYIPFALVNAFSDHCLCVELQNNALFVFCIRRDSELQSKPKSRIIPYNRDLMEFVLRTADDRTQRPYRTWYVYIVRTRVSHVCLSSVSNLSLTRCQRCQIYRTE